MRANKMLKLMDRQSLNIVAYRTKKDMELLIANGEAVRMCRDCGATADLRRCGLVPIDRVGLSKRIHGPRLPQGHAWIYRATTRFFQKDERTAAALTAQDSRANAGMGSQYSIRRARLRVGWWFLIVSDDRNPLPVTYPPGAACPLPVTRQPSPKPL